MINTKLDQIDLVALAEKSGAVLRKHGNEYRGACPIHGGKNKTSFVIYQTPDGQRWHCYTDCQTGGDAIKFVMMAHGLTREHAIEKLGLDDLPTRRPTPQAREAKLPQGKIWQQSAWRLIIEAERAMWSARGNRARDWLHARGLTDTTIKKWRLGLVVAPESGRFEKVSLWGLTEQETGKKAVWLPRGILIPCIDRGQVYYLKIRRPDPDLKDSGPKTPQVLGSRPGLLADFGLHQTVFLTEGEFDAMLLHQEAGDMVGVGTTGAAGHLPHGFWLDSLLSMRHLIVVGDADNAGRLHNEKWQQLSNRATVASPLAGKDITDSWKAGVNLRDWVKYWLNRMAPPPYKKIIWPAMSQLAVIGEQWSRLADGRIEAIYNDQEELELSLTITQLIRQWDQEGQPLPEQAEMFHAVHNYE